MIYSNACEYAFRALIYLPQMPEGEICKLPEISENEDIPYHFLAKIMQSLTRG